MRLSLTLICFLLICSVAAQKRAEVVFHTTEYIIESSSGATVKYHKKVKVLDKKGARQGVIVDQIGKFKKVSSATLTVYDETGKKLEKYGKKDSYNLNFNSTNEIDDSKIFLLQPETKSYPYIVEYEYEVKYDGIISFPRWYPILDHLVSVDKSELIVRVSSEAKIALHSMNNMPEPLKSEGEGQKVYRWKQTNIEPIEPNPYNSLFESLPFVYIIPLEFKIDGTNGSNKDWVSFGNWYFDLNYQSGHLNPTTDLSPDTKAKLVEIKRGSKTKEEIIKKTYDFMQQRTRYVSIQLGIGGWKSLPVEFVDSKGYGDCKALSTYMKTMLAFNGILSNYILVDAGPNRPDLLNDLPSNQFNHVFLGVPLENDTTFLECTSQTSPVNYLGTFTDGRDVLWIEKNGSKILRTPKKSSGDNLISTKVIASVKENGSAEMIVEKETTGIAFENYFRYEVMDTKDMEQMHYNRFPFKEYKVKNFDYQGNKEQLTLEESYNLEISDFTKKTGNRIVLKAGFLSDIGTISSSYLESGIIKVRRGKTLQDSYEIRIPENYRVSYKTEPIKISNEFGEYELTIKPDNGKINISRKLILNDGKYEGDQLSRYKEFYDKIRKSDNTKLLLTPKT